jgi:hypothetical protein
LTPSSHLHGIVSLGKDRPAWRHPLSGPLSALFDAFDFLRTPVSKPSQMFLTLGRGMPQGRS